MDLLSLLGSQVVLGMKMPMQFSYGTIGYARRCTRGKTSTPPPIHCGNFIQTFS
jgi:hypothetical protein